MGIKQSKTIYAKIYPTDYINEIDFVITNNPIQNNNNKTQLEIKKTPLEIKKTPLEIIKTPLEIIKTQFIDRLPEFLVIQIYKDYLEGEIYYEIYKNVIDSQQSRCLNSTKLTMIIPTILSKPLICKYISKKCPGFYNSFKSHKIDNEKCFHLLNKGQSFSQFVLMYLYH